MPLIHSPSKAAVSANIRREIDAGKSQKQAVAIALDIARRAKRAMGGRPPHVLPRLTQAPVSPRSLELHLGPLGAQPDKHLELRGEQAQPAYRNYHENPYFNDANPADRMQDISLKIAAKAKRATGGHVGPIHSAVGGRTDHLPMDVPEGSYVIPADVVSGLGEGNTNNGQKVLQKMFPAAGGAGKPNVPIMAAGGEFVVSTDEVKKLGNGDMKRGHNILDVFVKSQRKKVVKTLKGLPGPAK